MDFSDIRLQIEDEFEASPEMLFFGLDTELFTDKNVACHFGRADLYLQVTAMIPAIFNYFEFFRSS
jgi:hypothetical protein